MVFHLKPCLFFVLFFPFHYPYSFPLLKIDISNLCSM
nr:MAG TPA: hypothetical protein [Caudoviricetes sp.]